MQAGLQVGRPSPVVAVLQLGEVHFLIDLPVQAGAVGEPGAHLGIRSQRKRDKETTSFASTAAQRSKNSPNIRGSQLRPRALLVTVNIRSDHFPGSVDGGERDECSAHLDQPSDNGPGGRAQRPGLDTPQLIHPCPHRCLRPAIAMRGIALSDPPA